MARRDQQQYLKIAEFLTEEIRNGHLRPGDELPSEADLCEQFSTSRGPVRQAIATLRSQGKISSGRGRRSKVLGDFNAESFESTYSVAARFEALGIELKQKILTVESRPATEEEAEALHLKSGAPVVYIERLRYTESGARLYQQHTFPACVGQAVENYSEQSGSLHHLLMLSGVEIDSVNRVLTTIFADEELAELLHVEQGYPLWKTVQMIFDHHGDPVEYSIFTYRGDRMQLSMSTVKGASSPLRMNLISPEPPVGR